MPSIFRFSGNYEPILHDIDLFNNNKLLFQNTCTVVYSITPMPATNINLTTQEITLNTTGLKVNDIIYFEYSEFNCLSYKTVHITEIISETLTHTTLKINLNIIDNILPYTTAGSHNITVRTFKFIKKNTIFEHKFKDLGMIKDVTIAKVYDKVNPFQSNNDIYKVTNRFAYFDEHGIVEVNKNIFKSSWDLEFYNTTLSNKYKTK